MTETNINSHFCIAIDFKKDSEDPTRVFRAISELINNFHIFDNDILHSIDSNISPVVLLEDIEGGSIKTWLKYRIESVDDEVLKSGDWKKIMGHYLVNAKYLLIKFLDNKTEITDRVQIEDLEGQLFELAKESDILRIPSYSPVPYDILIKNLKNITDAASILQYEDKLTYITPDKAIPFNLTFKISPEAIEDLLTKEAITSKIEMILKVKKPDYLGDSMWDFKHETKAFPAKIMDDQWLDEFQNRKVDIRPGDSIRAKVEIMTKYSFNNEVISMHYSVLKVYDIIPLGVHRQASWIDEH